MDSQSGNSGEAHHNASQKGSEFWIASLYVAAFFRATVTLVLALSTMPVGSEMWIGTASVEGPEWLFNAVILTVLGVAAYKRQLWSGYGLILLAALDAVYKLMINAYLESVVGLLWLAFFATGTFHLARLKRVTSGDVTYRSQYSGRWIQATWITAFVAFFILLIGFLQGGQPLGVLSAACIVAGLGFGVLRGDQRFAWALVSYQALNTAFIFRGWDFSGTSVLKAIFSAGIMGIYLAGAIQLRHALIRSPAAKETEGQTWARIVYELAFLQAAWTLLLLLIDFRMPELLGDYVDAWNVIDAGVLGGLGYAAYRQRLWAGYGLTLYQLVNAVAAVSNVLSLPSEASRLAISIHVSILMLYAMGAYHFSRLKRQRSTETAKENEMARRAKVFQRPKVVRGGSEYLVHYESLHPPDVFFDTSVWRGLNDKDIDALRHLQQKRGLCYRYSVTNFVELASHLEDLPSTDCQDPFGMFRSCFRRIVKVCNQEILPSPEMEFLVIAGLEHYIDPVWIPDADQIAAKVNAIAGAKKVDDLRGVLDVSHYRSLRKTDRESMGALMEELQEFKQPITSAQVDKLLPWFMKLASFFLLVRPSNGKVHFNHLTQDERDKFTMALTGGAGKLFQTHCTTLVKRTINEGKKIDPNDLYDMLQLLLLRDQNRLFVTCDNAFFQYQLNDPQIERVLPWNGFRNSS